MGPKFVSQSSFQAYSRKYRVFFCCCHFCFKLGITVLVMNFVHFNLSQSCFPRIYALTNFSPPLQTQTVVSQVALECYSRFISDFKLQITEYRGKVLKETDQIKCSQLFQCKKRSQEIIFSYPIYISLPPIFSTHLLPNKPQHTTLVWTDTKSCSRRLHALTQSSIHIQGP